jgi:lipopolysaccharide transport system ATP-binding protein
MSTAIKFENISKEYRLGLVSTQTLSHDLNRWWKMNIQRKEDPYLKIGEVNDRATKGKSDYVWALKDINFEVQQGDVLGIIGKNGAGKSTLLKILSKVTAPTTGTIKARGRIASLLEVGTGFHPEMTGRENIFMNGAIMGMSKAEIKSKLDEIVDFSGVERYLDTPVKRYSSGMTVRLGFAIAAHLEPEILVVDEVLAVGDAEFQKKAIGKMQDVSRGEGRTVLFVSHNMGAISKLCKSVMILENGTKTFYGETNMGISKYLSSNLVASTEDFLKVRSKDFQLRAIVIRNAATKKSQAEYMTNEDVEIVFEFDILESVSMFRCGFDVIDQTNGETVFRTFHNDIQEKHQYSTGKYSFNAIIKGNLLKGARYFVSPIIGIHNVVSYTYMDIFIPLEYINIIGVNSTFGDERPGVISPHIFWNEREITCL